MVKVLINIHKVSRNKFRLCRVEGLSIANLSGTIRLHSFWLLKTLQYQFASFWDTLYMLKSVMLLLLKDIFRLCLKYNA